MIFSARDSGGSDELLCKITNPQDHSINDGEAVRSFEQLRRDVPRFRTVLSVSRGQTLFLAHLNLAQHLVGDRAVRALVEALLENSILVGDVQLYKNQLGDAAAQALAVLVEHSPSPGVRGLHLSHNYFSPLGVGMIIAAAAQSRHYPRQLDRPGKSLAKKNQEAAYSQVGRSQSNYDRWDHGSGEMRAPLWLRVHDQQMAWPMLDSPDPQQQLETARHVVEAKEAKLIKQSQARDLLPKDLPDDFHYLCIPEPLTGWGSLPGITPTAYEEARPVLPMQDQLRNTCSMRHCRFGNKHGPIVHLPYFWAQSGILTKAPPAADMKAKEENWNKWLPRVRGLAAKVAAGNAERRLKAQTAAAIAASEAQSLKRDAAEEEKAAVAKKEELEDSAKLESQDDVKSEAAVKEEEVCTKEEKEEVQKEADEVVEINSESGDSSAGDDEEVEGCPAEAEDATQASPRPWLWKRALHAEKAALEAAPEEPQDGPLAKRRRRLQVEGAPMGCYVTQNLDEEEEEEEEEEGEEEEDEAEEILDE